MRIRVIDPVTDQRWRDLLQRHPAASIFHSPEWLQALSRTYGYEPIAYVRVGASQEFLGGIPFCNISSLLTGRRVVSLPFSDHCEPLTANAKDLNELLSVIQEDVLRRRLKYVEIRPLINDDSRLAGGLGRSNIAVVHRVDLSGGRDQILNGFHKSSVLRKIKREQVPLRYEEGRSDDLLAAFYKLLILTRRRHQIPPQPFAWFRNLRDCLRDKLSVRVLFKDDRPAASTISLTFKNVVTYKYSCSDPEFNALAGTVHLIWRTIQDALEQGVTELDLGRSDIDNPGLITFKDHWGAVRSPLTYYRFPAGPERVQQSALSSAFRQLITKVPDSMFTAMGGLFYRHVG
jgi:CelD/BcsL family acetyltransferase involved in cellulose biosynthesis